jgi:electron transport complex protein RnfD
MRDVIIALLPTTFVGLYFFGYRAGILVAVSIISAVLAEYIWQRLAKKPVTIHDLSAAVTGLLLALNLPSTAPWWAAVIGSVTAIILVKQLFGGIGGNFLNPALTARAILVVSFGPLVSNFVSTNYSSSLGFMSVDALTVATPIVEPGSYSTMQLLFGNIPGCIGEVSKVAILLGFAYLLIRRVVKWNIPIIFVGTAVICGYLFSGLSANPLGYVLSGGLLFGAIFMATDYTTNPMTFLGEVIFAIGCGVIVAVIRQFSSNHEGVTYGILIMNIATPLIDKYIKPKVYGGKAHA